MPVADDVLKSQFISTHQVDKVALYSTMEDGLGYTARGTLAVGTPADPVFGGVYWASVANPYGRKCLMTLSWSVDGVNFYPQNVPLFYYNATHLAYYWQALGFGGCSDSLVYLACTTQYTADQTMYVQFALDSPT